ncbi:MAG: CPBP family intramembrane metalloprotease [Verrucomicrobiales bacterium]|nr:CPBP family intramembrane metalloprotease [Verrucomicrobiales bacterium]
MLSRRPWTIDSFTRLLFGVMCALAVASLTGALLVLALDRAWLGMLGLAGAAPAGGLAGLGFLLLRESWQELAQEQIQFVSGVTATLVLHACILVAVVSFLRANRLDWRTAFGIQLRGAGRGLQLALGVAVGFFLLSLGLMKLSELFWTQLGFTAEPQAAIEALQAGGILRPLLLAIVALGVAPIMEEIIYRGLLYPTIKQLGFPRAAFWGTAVLFAMSHVNLLSFLPLVCFGALLAWLYETTDNLLAPIAAHAVFNTINFVLALIVTGPVIP